MAKTTEMVEVSISQLKPYERNAKQHPAEQIEKLQQSIEEFGFISPCLIDRDGNIIAGHGRVEAAKALGMETVPALYVEGLTDVQRRAYILADNRLTELGGWDMDIVEYELNTLANEDFDIELIGFDPIKKKTKQVDPDQARETLADRFLISPFSVLDSRQKYWQDRKRAWKAIGIDSNLGRGNDGDSTVDGLTFANSYKPPNVYTAKNKIQDALGRRITWDEFYDAMPSYAILPNTSTFDPVVCELAYRWYTKMGDRVLDPFAGGSVRGITASLLGRQYTGIDLSERQVEENRNNWAAMQHERITDGGPAEPPRWITGDSAKMDSLVPEGDFDFLFTCPPYADLEVYSDDPDDLSNMEYSKFCETYAAIIKAAVGKLKKDAFACVVVGDIRDKKRGIYRDFVSFTIDAFRRAGMGLYNEGILVTSIGTLAVTVTKQFEGSRKLGKNHQNVLVFQDLRGTVREYNMDDEAELAEQITETVEQTEAQFTPNHLKMLTFAKGDAKQRTAELGAVETETMETFEVDL